MTIDSGPGLKRLSIPFYLIIGGVILVFVQTFSILAPVYLSFLLTLLISLALNPLVNRLRSFLGGRKGATATIILGMLMFIALSGWAFYIPLRDSVSNFAEAMPQYWERLQKPLIKMEQHATRSEERMQDEVTREITKAGDTEIRKYQLEQRETEPFNSTVDANTIRSSLAQMLRGVIGSFTKLAFNGAQMLVVLVTVFFGVIFMLMNPRPIVSALLSFVPTSHQDKAISIMHRIARFAPAWGGSTLAGMVTIGSLVFVMMWPLLGIMDAMVLGLIAGLLESIPFLGPTLSTVPALLLAMGKGGYTPLWVLLAYIVIQALENNIILPLIMSRGMKLHAVAIIFSMLISVTAFGVLGVLIAAPLVAIVGIIHEELYRKKFLPSVTDSQLDSFAGKILHEANI